MRAAVLAIATAPMLVACNGGGESQSGPAPTRATVTVTETATVTASPTPSPTPTPAEGTLALGESANFTSSDGQGGTLRFSVTATELRHPWDPLLQGDRPERRGFVYATAHVEWCLEQSDTRVQLSEFPWTLRYDDGQVFGTAGVSPESFPAPLYAYTNPQVTQGDCVTGWLAFEVPKQTPDSIVYESDGGERAEWSVS